MSDPKPVAKPTLAPGAAPAAAPEPKKPLDDIAALSRCADVIDRVATVEERQRVVKYLSTKYLPPVAP